METKPKIDFDISRTQLIESLSNRIGSAPKYHIKTEVICNSILNMMLEKTIMYGGDNNNIPFDEKLLRSYYEGVGRKAGRIPTLMKNAIEGSKSSKLELLDTYIDVVGYGLMALNAIAEEIQRECYEQ